jgi:hypothetical protein
MHEGRFARPVFSQKGMDLPGPEFKIRALQSMDPIGGKIFLYTPKLYHVFPPVLKPPPD